MIKKDKKSKINEKFIKQSNENINLLTGAAELAIKNKVPVSKSYRDQFLKGATEYIV